MSTLYHACKDCIFKRSRKVPCKRHDPSHLIQKVCILFEDYFAKKMIQRHCTLIQNYIESSPSGILLQDVQYVITVLEVLSSSYNDVPQYCTLLKQLLNLCTMAPLMNELSDGVCSIKEMQKFFNKLGFLLLKLYDTDFCQAIICAIHSLIVCPSPEGIWCVQLKDRLTAVKASNLATTVGQLLDKGDHPMYSDMVSLAEILTEISHICGLQLISAGGLSSMLQHLKENHPMMLSSSPSIEQIEFDEMMCNLLWSLMHIAYTSEETSEMKFILKPPSIEALSSLRMAFRNAVIQGRQHTRNSLAGIVIIMLQMFPQMLIVESGLAEDLINLSVSPELEDNEEWAEGINFLTSTFDFELKQHLLLALCYLAKYPAACKIIKARRIIPALMQLVEPGLTQPNVLPRQAQMWCLLNLTLRLLSVLVKYLPEQLLLDNGLARILLLLEWYIERPYDQEVLCNCVSVLIHLTVTENEETLRSVREHDTANIIIRICQNFVNKSLLPLPEQHMLTLCFLLLSQLCSNNSDQQEKCTVGALNLAKSFLSKVSLPELGQIATDDRLIICALDFLWECIVWCPKNCQLFVKDGGVYKLLDLLKCSIFPIQMMVLAVLVDLTEQGNCVPHLITWRDHQGNGYLPLLLSIWREEEKRLGVPRDKYGAIRDIEMPLMGKLQYYYTNIKLHNGNASPAVADIHGSIRPKIYAIIQLLKYRHKLSVEESENMYKIYQNKLTYEDQVTLHVAHNFLALKMGEVWKEVERDMQVAGLKPLAVDGEVVGVLSERLHIWGAHIQNLQYSVLKEMFQKMKLETIRYNQKIDESKVPQRMKAINELESLAAAADRQFYKMQLEHEREAVTANFPEQLSRRCQRTFDVNSPKKLTVNDFFTAPLSSDLKTSRVKACTASISSHNTQETNPPLGSAQD